MKKLTREDFIECVGALLSERGYHGFSLTDILNACGANKGSLYHFFPEGKDGLVMAAIDRNMSCAAKGVQEILNRADDFPTGVYRVAMNAAKRLAEHDYRFGMPFSAIAATASDEPIRAACEKAFLKFESSFFERMKGDGIPAREARNLASVIVSTLDGAHIQARARRTSRPLRCAADTLRSVLASYYSKRQPPTA